MVGIGLLMPRAQGHDHVACRDERRLTNSAGSAVECGASKRSNAGQARPQNIVMAKFYDAIALVGRIPVWAHSAAEWLSPRPLTQLLDPNVLKVSL